jgi:hypothetical protein
VLDRGEKIELLVDKTEDLRSQVHSTLTLAWDSFTSSTKLSQDSPVSPIGTRLQATGNKDTAEDVVGEYEDEAHRFWHRGCPDPPHCLDNLQGLQLLVM